MCVLTSATADLAGLTSLLLCGVGGEYPTERTLLLLLILVLSAAALPVRWTVVALPMAASSSAK